MDEQILAMKDKEIAEQMRLDNYERFKTLVKMHLSFELDLNTDEFDLPVHEVIYMEKGKLKSWTRLSKKIRSCTSTKFNSPSERNSIVLTLELINQLRKLKEFILKEENVTQEGVFRRTGAISRQNELRTLINKNSNISITENYSVHDCATVFKGFLADLPEPLLTDAHYPAHCQIADLCNSMKTSTSENKLLSSVQLLVLLLPDENRILLEHIIDMLHQTVQYEESNKMTSETLSTLFTPHLICPRNLPPEGLHYIAQNMSSVITYMIRKGLEIFELPSKFATDIRAYYIDQKRKRTMSPEQILDESISDISTVNTVYTFVDREKTAAAHNANPTDTALAQLYAHIQSMPESSKKRKLIKQFNKENGQGTPLQLLMTDRGKSAGPNRSGKSISDSIKKHIFNKNIISRTPKRSNSSSAFSTPNSTSANPKLRVLFQSPIVCSPTVDNSSSKKTISSASLLTPNRETLQKFAPATTTTSMTPSEDAVDSNADNSSITPENSEEDQSEKDDIESSIKKLEVTPQNIYPKRCCRYQSEPNISTVLVDENLENTADHNGLLPVKRPKYMSTENLHSASMNASIARRASVSHQRLPAINETAPSTLLKTAENTPKFENSQSLNVYRNIDLITSTPSLFLGRRSMSPITKSTQRMPKAMQESIMTPRSRKPVMLATTMCSSEAAHTTYQSDLSCFREQDEDSMLNFDVSPNPGSPQNKDANEVDESSTNDKIKEDVSERIKEESIISSACVSLTNTFRQYLLSRSVLTTSPVDSSFSSHPDDFGSNTDLQNLSESQMSTSLLYFLNGNEPTDNTSGLESNDHCDISSVKAARGRKRSATESIQLDDQNSNDGQVKKILVLEEDPRETSF